MISKFELMPVEHRMFVIVWTADAIDKQKNEQFGYNVENMIAAESFDDASPVKDRVLQHRSLVSWSMTDS